MKKFKSIALKVLGAIGALIVLVYGYLMITK